MPIATPYDATTMTGYRQDAIEKVLSTAKAAGSLTKASEAHDSMSQIYWSGASNAYLILDQKGHHVQALPSLKVPYALIDPTTKRSDIFIDCRTIVSMDNVSLNFRLKAGSFKEYEMQALQAGLMRLWLDGHQVEMRNFSPLPAVIFARWISSTLAQKYMLDPREQETIEIICGYYYYGLFTKESINSETVDKVAGYLSRHMGMLASRCYEVIDAIGNDVNSIDDLCKTFYEVTGSIRLKEFNAGHLIVAVGMSYFGMTGKMLVGIALEYPPIWLSMLYFAINDALYRKSVIGTMLEKGGMKSKAQVFAAALIDMVQLYNNEG